MCKPNSKGSAGELEELRSPTAAADGPQRVASTPMWTKTRRGSAKNSVVTNNATSLNLSGAFSGNVSGNISGNGGGLTNVSGTLQWQIVSGTAQQAQPNTGYLLTNNSLVTVTLPASPNLGDVVRSVAAAQS